MKTPIIESPSFRSGIFLLTFAFTVLGLPAISQAQTTPAPPAQTPAPVTLTVVRVVEQQVPVNSKITIVVDKLDEWLKNPQHDYRKFQLVIDGVLFKTLEAPGLVDEKDADGKPQKALRFDPLRTKDNRESWMQVFAKRRRDEFSNRYVHITVQQEGVQVFGDSGTNLTVIDTSSKRFWVFIFATIAFLAFGWYLCKFTDMIRAPGQDPSGLNAKGKPNRKVYSLARTQMAFWFFVVIISYSFIWMVTSYLSNLPASVLTLIGISTATGLSSAVVDSNKRTEQETKRRQLQEQLDTETTEGKKLTDEIAAIQDTLAAAAPTVDLNAQRSALIDRQSALEKNQKEIAQTTKDLNDLIAQLAPEVSNNFINDVLSDDDGVSFHRLQIFGWTIVLILIFVVSVYDVLSMPDFDTTLLALMGISGGTYIGFKLPNQQG